MVARRRQSLRLAGYDYGQEDAYFVTICVANRRTLFGTIGTDGSVRLSGLGKIAEDCLLQVPRHFPRVSVGHSIVTLNHVHMILIFESGTRRGVQLNAPTPSPARKTGSQSVRISPRRNTLGVVVRTYKGAVTKRARAEGLANSDW
jgi:hypothetical protein